MNEDQKNKLKERIRETLNEILERHKEDLMGDSMFSGILGNAVNYMKIELMKATEKDPEQVREWLRTFRNAIKKDLKDFDRLLK